MAMFWPQVGTVRRHRLLLTFFFRPQQIYSFHRVAEVRDRGMLPPTTSATLSASVISSLVYPASTHCMR